MYRYDEFDAEFVNQRVAQFRQQCQRRISGELSEDEFKPLRLMNGLYLQLHAYMLRVAIPYGTLNSEQLRKLAFIAKHYDKDYGHFTTRQNIQYNWVKLEDTADILQHLAQVEMHAIQTSGNCIRNVTSDPWSGVAVDEVADTRPYAEFLRQWSSLHPEFSFLPRKFKIAISGAKEDRAAIRVHDLGLRLKHNADGDAVFEVYIGGGQGRTPKIGKLIKDNLSPAHLLSYTQAIMRVYNQYGRRDNMYKARIKILVQEVGVDDLRVQVEEAFKHILANQHHDEIRIEQAEIERIEQYFAPPKYKTITPEQLTQIEQQFTDTKSQSVEFARWCKNNVAQHQVDGYKIVNISLKPKGGIPGDASSEQMHIIADLAEHYSLDELRITHRQNIVLPYVETEHVFHVWQQLSQYNLAADNFDKATDIISCPGLDYCSLATARSIPIAQQISELLESEYQDLAGNLHINISGCINACGHHHVGNIGILGLNKNGQEYFQFAVGGDYGYDGSIAERLGPGISEQQVPKAVKALIDKYIELRQSQQERFISTYRRIGSEPFKEALYASVD